MLGRRAGGVAWLTEVRQVLLVCVVFEAVEYAL